MNRKINKILIILIMIIIALGISHTNSHAASGKPGETVKVTYTIQSPDGANLDTVTGKLTYDQTILEYISISSSAGKANNATVSATRDQIGGTSMTVTAEFKIKEGAQETTTSPILNLSELYTVGSEENKSKSLTDTIAVTVPTPVVTPEPEQPTPTPEETTSTPEEKPTTTPEQQEPEKSSNANLKNLGIKPIEYDFNNFKSTRTSYTATVPYEIEDVEAWYEKSDEKATVKVTGGSDLKVGKNTITVEVTAESGKTKEYTITVTRKEKEEEIEEEPEVIEEEEQEDEPTVVAETGEGIKKLSIAGVTLSPKFSTDIYEYTAKLTKKIDELEIEAETTSENYTYSIAGNENLVDGENLVNLIVYDEKNTVIATYQIVVTKNTINQTEVDDMFNEVQEKEQTKNIILAVVIAIILVLIITYFVIRKKVKTNKIRQYSEDECIIEDEMQKIEEKDNNNELIGKKKGKHF